MPPDINHGDATGLLYTVQKNLHIIFLVSLNGAEFPMWNQRRNASPPTTVNCTVRKYLTAREIEKLMDHARKHSRYGHRDSTMILVAYRHGLRASEVCDLQWHQVELDHGRSTSAGPRTARHPFILSGAMRFVPYASFAVKARMRLTSSSRSAADQ